VMLSFLWGESRIRDHTLRLCCYLSCLALHIFDSEAVVRLRLGGCLISTRSTTSELIR
jgi:hypothetical protein